MDMGWGNTEMDQGEEVKREKKKGKEPESKRDKEQWKTERKEIEQNHRDSKARKIETGDRKRERQEESDSGSQYFLNSFASTQLGIKAIIPGLIPNPTELAAFRDKPGWQPINKAGMDKNNTYAHDTHTHTQPDTGRHASCN